MFSRVYIKAGKSGKLQRIRISSKKMSARKRKRTTWTKGKKPWAGPGGSRKRTRLEEAVAAAVAVASPRPELKFHDLSVDEGNVPSAGAIAAASVLEIPEGTGESERVGRKITVKQIGWRFHQTIEASTSSGTTSNVFRVMLYWDKQTNGATATVTDILSTANYQSFNNLNNRGRFRILMDRTYGLNAHAGGGNGTSEDYGEFLVEDTFFKKVNIPIEYTDDAPTGAIATMTSNNIGVLVICKSNLLVAFESFMRIRYIDG